MNSISLKYLLLRFKWRISFTSLLVILESVLDIMFPLFIGYAINDLLAGKYTGIIRIFLLGILLLIIGTARRFYDTRIYAGIYSQITPEIVASEYSKNSSVSKITARSSLLTEFVEFLENSMPEVIGAIFSLIGIISIIATLNIQVFYACIALLFLIFIIYLVTGKFNFRLNAQYNEQLEKQVEILESRNNIFIKNYFKDLMKWNIKLSDLETINYFIIWIGIIALVVFTPITVIESGILEYGLVFSTLMYVFEYINKILAFPFYIQQLIRLKEISNRLK